MSNTLGRALIRTHARYNGITTPFWLRGGRLRYPGRPQALCASTVTRGSETSSLRGLCCGGRGKACDAVEPGSMAHRQRILSAQRSINLQGIEDQIKKRLAQPTGSRRAATSRWCRGRNPSSAYLQVNAPTLGCTPLELRQVGKHACRAITQGASRTIDWPSQGWTVSPETPLTAWKAVNRMWYELCLETGLVARRPEDFGIMGQRR